MSRQAAYVSRIALAILLAGCGHKPQVLAVDIRNMAFAPANLPAHAGDTIVFTNHDFVPHTVTARDHSWDSGSIAPNGSWRMAVQKGGAYFCTFHPNMTGTIALK